MSHNRIFFKLLLFMSSYREERSNQYAEPYTCPSAYLVAKWADRFVLYPYYAFFINYILWKFCYIKLLSHSRKERFLIWGSGGILLCIVSPSIQPPRLSISTFIISRIVSSSWVRSSIKCCASSVLRRRRHTQYYYLSVPEPKYYKFHIPWSFSFNATNLS